jgi:hypothetical protein
MAIFDNVTVELSSFDGNAFSVMANVKRAIEKAGATQEQVESYLAESMSGDYHNLLRTAMKWVNVE